MSFGEQIKRARIRNALTQAELGAKVGVTGMTMSYWERGRVRPSKDKKEQMRSILGIEYRTTPAPKSEDSIDTEGEGPSAFAAWLNKARVERQMSVNELATDSGLSAPTIMPSNRVE